MGPGGLHRKPLVDAPTPIGWIIGRTRTDGPADYAAVNAIQDGFSATPLSSWPKVEEPGDVTPDPSIDMKTAPRLQVEALSGPAFMTYGAELMSLHRPHLTDQPILARMARLGLHPSEPFDVASAAPDVAAAIELAPAAAQQRMAETEPRLSPLVNGWARPTSGMGVYGTDYLRRAVVARIGLGANLVEDAIYPVLYADADGDVPDGANDQVLRFEAGQLPPAECVLVGHDVRRRRVPGAERHRWLRAR